MIRHLTWTLLLGLVSSACSGGQTTDVIPTPSASTTVVVTSAPTGSVTPPDPNAEPFRGALKKKLAEVTRDDLALALTKLGWVLEPGSNGGAIGAWKVESFSAKQATLSAKITIVLPSGKPDGASGGMVPPRELPKTYPATYVESDDAALYVEIAGSPGTAQSLVDGLFGPKTP